MGVGDHGDRWGYLVGDAKYGGSLIVATIREGEVIDGRSFRDPKMGPVAIQGVLSGPPPLCALGVLRSVGEEARSTVISGYPFALGGIQHVVEVRAVHEYQNGAEALIEGIIGGGTWICFFDALYFLNRRTYTIGKRYTFSLAGLAFHAQHASTKAVNLDKVRRAAGQSTTDGVADMFVSTQGQVATFPAKGAKVRPIGDGLEGWGLHHIVTPQTDVEYTDYEFRCPIKQVSTVSFFGMPLTQARVPLFRQGRDIDIALYLPAAALEKGFQPRVGDDLKGFLWLQGYRIDDASDVIAIEVLSNAKLTESR